VDHPGARDEVVHARAVDDDRVRDRPAAGGIFRTVMRSPEGQEIPNVGCYLEVAEHERLVWTVALGPGFRPVNNSPVGFPFTAVISLEPHGAGTKYRALAMHRDPEERKQHEAMGFHDGWGKALDQLVALARRL
jgi:uncharacterized protein YndB with AHSA1/START domain